MGEPTLLKYGRLGAWLIHLSNINIQAVYCNNLGLPYEASKFNIDKSEEEEKTYKYLMYS